MEAFSKLRHPPLWWLQSVSLWHKTSQLTHHIISSMHHWKTIMEILPCGFPSIKCYFASFGESPKCPEVLKESNPGGRYWHPPYESRRDTVFKSLSSVLKGSKSGAWKDQNENRHRERIELFYGDGNFSTTQIQTAQQQDELGLDLWAQIVICQPGIKPITASDSSVHSTAWWNAVEKKPEIHEGKRLPNPGKW